MKFRGLQENLRQTLWERVEQGTLTGLKLAGQTGFQQAHISNFLNGKRSLSLEGLDRVLQVQRLSVLDLLDPAEVNQRVTMPPPGEDEFENVFLVDGEVAATAPLIMRMKVKEIEKFRRSFLRQLRPDLGRKRRGWERFVAVRVEGNDAMSMYPRLRAGAKVLIDRHYRSLRAYRKGESNLYAVYVQGRCLVRYVEPAGKSLVLRPHNRAGAVEIIPAQEQGRRGLVVGRICHIAVEA
jgi:transcriptional regulator with XRE-family HTH domain